MIYGIGIDIMSVAQLEPLGQTGDYADPFFTIGFTERERMQALASPQPLVYFASHFAGKEAVYKAINQGLFGFAPHEIEVLDTSFGMPEVTLYGRTAEITASLSIDLAIHVSLSSDASFVIAQAVAECT